MIKMEGEVTEVATPPNKADQVREVTIWVPDTQEHIEFTFLLHDFQKSEIGIGDTVTIKVDKKLDIDSLARDLLRNP